MASIINAGQTALTVTPDTTGALTIQANGTSAIAIDNTQRVGLGTTTPNTRLHVTGAGSGIFGVYDDVAKFKGTSYTYIHLDGTNNQSGMVISANTDKGWFVGHDNSQGLKFARMTSLNQDGISNAKDSGTPSMLLTAAGELLIGAASTSSLGAADGIQAYGTGYLYATVNNDAPGGFARRSSDGDLVLFRRDTTGVGSISVSGSTVSYNGGHLSRWAQIFGGNTNIILKGTVLSNLDEMNVYVNKENETVLNEQLNKVKISNIEADANVAGVFVSWSYDEQHDIEEINMAMTGDMIIRIAEGVTVARGDLLMSAGDGTAKPQGDDIVRSKTIAKVTSTHITCTYEDGSYCVPCVLMAC